MNFEDIEKIVGILKQSDIHEFELEQDGVKIKLTRGAVNSGAGFAVLSSGNAVTESFVQPVSSSPHMIINNQPGSSVKEAPVDSNLVQVKSPLVGTFYRKPSPTAEPFVKEGAAVKKGATICIVEAMKLMNEIEAPCDGTISSIPVNEGDVVEFGEVLFSIKPN